MISAGSNIPSITERGGIWPRRGANLRRWQAAMPSALVVLPCLLVGGCGSSDTKAVATAEPAPPRPAYAKADILVPFPPRTIATARPTAIDSFADRYFADSFDDRYSAAHSFGPEPARSTVADRRAPAPPSYKLASLSPDLPYVPVIKHEQTQLIGFENSAFPYFGKNPRSGDGAYAGGRYSDNRVLVHVPAGFDARKPGVIVVFFHGHGATLARDVRDRRFECREALGARRVQAVHGRGGRAARTRLR